MKMVTLKVDVPFKERLFFKALGAIWYTSRTVMAPPEVVEMLVAIYGRG